MKVKAATYKRAWRQLQLLQKAGNLIECQVLVDAAWAYTFKLYNHGTYRIRARRAGVTETKINGQLEFWRTMAEMNRAEFFKAVMPYFPARLKTHHNYAEIARRYGITIYQLPNIHS